MGAATKSGNDERIQNLQGRQERQQQLDAPVQLRELSCLRNARIFLRGYSELRQYGSWLHQALRCNAPALVKMDECQRELTPAGEAWPPASLYRNLSSCREKLYSRRPYETRCPSLNVTIHFEWKARMWCDYDARFLQRVARAADASDGSAPLIVVISGGPR